MHKLRPLIISKVIEVLLLLMVGIMLVGCTGSGSAEAVPTLAQFPSNTDTPVANAALQTTVTANLTGEAQSVSTDTATASTAANSEIQEEATSDYVTEEVEMQTLQVQVAETPEVFATAETVRYKNDAGDLFIVVTGLLYRDQIPTLPPAPNGEQYVVLNTTIANLTGEPITIEAASLTLIDREFNRYSPVAPEDLFRTPIVGVETNGVSTTLGLVRFSIPRDAVPYLLEWCPLNDCAIETLQTRIP